MSCFQKLTEIKKLWNTVLSISLILIYIKTIHDLQKSYLKIFGGFVDVFDQKYVTEVRHDYKW